MTVELNNEIENITDKKIAFIGAGNMSNAVISGLIRAGYSACNITVTAPSKTRRELLTQAFGVLNCEDNVAAVLNADVIILAVKPQIMNQVCRALADVLFASNKLIMTLAAGIKLSRYQGWFGINSAIIRVMPNTPSLVGMGMSGVYSSRTVNDEQKRVATSILQSIGKVMWLSDERQINHVIAAAGSAPAYFFMFMQAMQNAAQHSGCTPEEAKILVQQAGVGAMALMQASSALSFNDLATQVTSKGGTTAQALAVFEREDLAGIVNQAMMAAITRAEEMENEF